MRLMVYLCPEPAQPFLYIWVHAPLKRPFPAQQRAQAYGPRTRLRPCLAFSHLQLLVLSSPLILKRRKETAILRSCMWVC